MAASPTIPNPELKLETEDNAEKAIVHGAGKITSTSSDLLQSTIRRLIYLKKHVVIDLSGVDYVDSSGLGALVSVYVAAGRANCVLELANPKQRVRDMFKLTRVSSIFGEGYEDSNFGGF